LKIKNRQDNESPNNDNKNENQNNIDETDIQLYIQSFSHCNEQLKSNLLNISIINIVLSILFTIIITKKGKQKYYLFTPIPRNAQSRNKR
ncbi:MAG: hypothetical protein IK021_01395, partial [Methanobrevibacter sp.]|nr:hypothetical protein [Methanobrevibacter sp.]